MYGIEANTFALHSVNVAVPELGPLPNLGYFVTANLSVPIWDWGSLQSKLSQAQVRRRQATVELTQAQRLLIRNLYSRATTRPWPRAPRWTTRGRRRVSPTRACA